jgi:hypothetical protein
MSGKTLLQVRDRATELAEQRGHRIKRWNRLGADRYAAICTFCGARLSVYSRTSDIKTVIAADGFFEHGGLIIARDRDLYWTERDYNVAEGEALATLCYEAPTSSSR